MILSFLLIKKFFPILSAFFVLIFSLLAIFIVQYSFVFYLVSVSLAIIVSSFFLLLLLGKEVNRLWPFLIFFFLLIASFNVFLVFSKSQAAQIIFIFITSLFSYLFLSAVFGFIYAPRKYPPYSLENFSSAVSFAVSFLIFSIFFAAITFFNFSLIISLAAVFLIGLALPIFLFWLVKLKPPLAHYFVIALITLQLFYTLTLLPTSFYINSFVLTLLLFVAINLAIRENKDGLLSRKTIQRHLFFTVLILILICLLAEWR